MANKSGKTILTIRFIVLLVATTCFSRITEAQKTYHIKDGELQFICFDGGLVVKKSDGYYRLSFRDYIDTNVDYIKLEPADFEKRKAYENTVFKKDIDKSVSLNNLRNIKFSYVDDGDEDYSFLLNDFLFAGFSLRKDDSIPSFNDVLPFAYIEINGLKFIYIFEDGVFILSTQSGIKVLASKNYNDKTIIKITRHITTADELSKCSNEIKSNHEDYYSVSATVRNKYQLKNKSGKAVIPKTYDNITMDKVIICKSGNSFDLYNYQHTKLHQQPLKAFHVYYNCVQFIQDNELITKTYNGAVTTAKKYEGFQYPYEPNGTTLYEFNVQKEGNQFYVFVKAGLNGIAEKIKLENTNHVRSVFFHNNQSLKHIDYLNRYLDCPVYYKQQNGKFGFTILGKLINKLNDDYGVFKHYQDLQSVKGIRSKLFKLEKQHLFMYYPLQQKFRYTLLADFDGYFARFELPNGKKGWLALNGKEYVDD